MGMGQDFSSLDPVAGGATRGRETHGIVRDQSNPGKTPTVPLSLHRSKLGCDKATTVPKTRGERARIPSAPNKHQRSCRLGKTPRERLAERSAPPNAVPLP